MSARVVIAGGGTGGHVTPALALGEVFRDAGDETLFVGTDRGMEKRLVPEAGFELVTLASRPLVGRSLLDRMRALLGLAATTWRARRVLRRFRTDLVISVGGYAAVPPTLAAASLGVPVALVEPNAVPGAANRLGARFARRIYCGFAEGARSLAGDADPRLRITGVPLRAELVEAFSAGSRRREPEPPFRVFVFGGSQGARQINEAVLGALSRLTPERFEFVHQTGEADRERVERGYQQAGFRATVLAFERAMATRYAWADLVVCRSGAFTLAELALAGRPAVLVPLAHTGGGEQPGNARARAEAGAAVLLDGDGDEGAALAVLLESLFAAPARLAEMAEAAAALARPGAAHEIVEDCRELLGAPA